MFERAFVQKMFVELCASFRPEHAKTIFSLILSYFFLNERSCDLGVWYRPTDTTLWVVHHSSWKLPPCTKEVGSIEAPWQMTPAAACLKGHSCEDWLSNCVLDLDLNMPKHLSSILNYFFSNERSCGLHCYSIKGNWVPLLSVFSLQEQTGSSM